MAGSGGIKLRPLSILWANEIMGELASGGEGIKVANSSGDDGGDGFAGKGSASKRTIAAEAVKVLGVDEPFSLRVDEGDIGDGAGGDAGRFEVKNGGGICGKLLD